jgi:hypothetical protein
MQVWAECRLALYRYVLRLNEELSIAKFGLSHDGRLVLMIDWPTHNLSFSAFETAVQVLLTYYETYYPDIQLAAQDTAVARQIAARELDELAREEAISQQITILES